MKIKEILRQAFSLLVIFVYSFVILFQNIPFLTSYIDSVRAENVAEKTNLVLVLVDGKIYNALKGDLSFYSQYIQKQAKNTKALIFPIDTSSITSFDIYKVIQNLYFNGQKTETSFLKTIVLIGDIPLPVINRNGYVFTSIYPYVDVVNPTFIPKNGYFVPSGKKTDAELTHGIIKFSNINDYHKYFDKLKKYSENPSSFVDKKIYYDNFVKQKSSYNKDLEKEYTNKIIFAENLITKKITPLILEIFDKQQKDGAKKILDDLKSINNSLSFNTFKSPKSITKGGFIGKGLGFSKKRLSSFSDSEKIYYQQGKKYEQKVKSMLSKIESISNPYWMIPTKSLESTVKNFVKNYSQLYGNTYSSEITKNIEATGRYTWTSALSSLNSIDLKDNVSVNYINAINKFLEKQVDLQVNSLYKKYPLGTYYTKSEGFCSSRYETFFFGKNAKNVKSISDLHVYRGTYGNYKDLSILNSIPSRGGKSSVSIMNNLFDMQTLSNRGYNTFENTKKDGDNYKKQCVYKGYYLGRACSDLGRSGGENIASWASRIYGGYSPLNIKASGSYDPNNIHFNTENYKYAWNPSYAPAKNGTLFDLGGTVENKNKQDKTYTDTISAINKYNSVLRTEHGVFVGGDDGTCNTVYDQGAKTFGTYKISHPIYIDTRVKHVSPTNYQFSKFNIGTSLRPVDSKNYITFLSKNDKTVTFYYPDLFSVNVYKKNGNKYVLKTVNEIFLSIKEYLKNLVKNYNNSAGSNIPEDFLVKKLGDKKIAQIAEMLYYLNLGWKEKPVFSNLKDEIDYLQKSFNINEKLSYVVSHNMDTETSFKVGNVDIKNSDLNFPQKPKNAYEVGMIVSKNLDELGNDKKNKLPGLNNLNFLQDNLPIKVGEGPQKECGRPLGQAVILWEWPAAFMCRLKEVLKKPFKIGSSYACTVGNAPDKTLDDDPSPEAENVKLEEEYSKKGDDFAKEFEKLKDYVNNDIIIKSNQSSYLSDEQSGSIFIKNYNALPVLNNSIKSIYVFSPKKEGNCFYFDINGEYKNSCDGFSIGPDRWKLNFYFFNPKTGEGKFYSYKAGEKILGFKFCDTNNVCYVKELRFDKLPGKLKYVEIKPYSPVMVAGGENPVVIIGYDAKKGEGRYQNKVNYTEYNYNLYLDPPIGGIKLNLDQDAYQKVNYNFDSTQNLVLIKANKVIPASIKKFNIVLELDKTWQKVLKNNKNVVKKVTKSIGISNKKNLTSSEINLIPSNYQLNSDIDSIIKNVDGVKTYDKSKLLKLHIEPKINGKILKTPVYVESTSHFIVGTFQKAQTTIKDNGNTKVVNYDKFVKNNRFLILDDKGLDVYLLPTFKTGKYKIKVKIPGLNTYVINGTLKDFPTKDIYISLDKTKLKKGEKVLGKVYKVDKFNNPTLLDLSKVNITTSSGINVRKNGNNIELRAIRGGFVKFKYKNFEKTVYINVENTFMPLNGKISVMYLTLLGYDWGKYASRIMANSGKNLAITTVLHSSDSIKNYDYIIGQNLKNYGGFVSQLTFSPGKFVINLGNFNITYNKNVFPIVKKISSLKDILSDGVYYIPEKTDSIITKNNLVDNILFVNNKKVIEFSTQSMDENIKIIYNPNLSKKYGVYDIIYINKKIGELVFNGEILPISGFNISKPFSYDIIPGEGTTNGIKAIGINIGNFVPYTTIFPQLKLDVDKEPGLGFRSNFRNITDFAAGNDVGQSTRPFENELLINFGDPFVKRISKEKTIPEVNVSKTYGRRIFSSINGGIKKVVTMDFNGDGLKDLIIAYKGGKIRILKNYKGYNNFEDLGNLIILPKDIDTIYGGDLDGDKYEDLFVVFKDKTIRVYKNNRGEFDVDGTPVCLPLPGSDGYHLDYDQLFFYDMDHDGKTDIVVNDRNSNVVIYYGDSYLSKDKKFCDAGYKSRIKSKLLKSYGMEVDPNKKFADAGYIYRDGMKNNSTFLKDKFKQAFKNGSIASLPTKDINIYNYTEKVSKAGKNKFAFQAIPKVLGPSYVNLKDNIEFKKVTYMEENDDVKVYKTMKDDNGDILKPGDIVTVTVHIDNPKGKKITYLEELKGPFAVISENDKPKLEFKGIDKKYISYPNGAYSEFLFRLDATNSKKIEVSYKAYFLGSSSVTIKVDDWDKNNYGDVKVFLKNGCIKGYDYFQGLGGTNFKYSYVDLAKKLREFNNNSKGAKKIDEIQKKVKNGDYTSLIKKYVKSSTDDIFGSLLKGENVDINISSPDLSSIKARVNGILKGLCKGYSFGKSSCSGSPIPCNYAFLAPGIINYCGCPGGVDPGSPIFRGFMPYKELLPYRQPYLLEPNVHNNSWKGGTSSLRIYLSPTLSMGLGLAVCFGSYAKGMRSPSAPLGAIMGNCVVVAAELSAKCKKKNADDELDGWMNDLGANGVCQSLPVDTGIFPTTSISSKGFKSFEAAPFSSNIHAGLSVNGKTLISFSATAHKINSLADAKHFMEGGIPLNLHIRMGTFKGIISCIIKKWLNHQIQFTISQLTHMTVYVTYPDMSGLMEGFDRKDWLSFGKGGVDLGKVIKDFSIGGGNGQDGVGNIVSAYLPAKKGLKTLSKELSNPFKALGDYINKIPLVNVNYKTVTIKVPWIGKDEIERQIAYLQNRVDKNEQYLNENINNLKNPKFALKARSFINSVKKNIYILEQYKKFPLKLYKYLHALDFYLDQVLCIIKLYIKTIVGWLNTQSKIFEKWVDAIIALINIFRTWQLLIDVSVDWKSSCGKCRQDTGDLYDCTLVGLCPSLPVLPIPPFKIPDIFVDFTHIDLGINIVLPKIKIQPVPIGLFTLPDLPVVSAGLTVKLPKLPILPAPPKLPPLPGIPPVPTIELPNLPPPPKIPKLMPALHIALDIFKIAGYFRCIIKNGIGLVAEWNVKTRIEQLTARHNRLRPFDFINIDFPELPFKGFDVKVDGYLRYRVEMKQLYKAVKKIADRINKKTKPMIGEMLKFNLKVNKKSSEINNKLHDGAGKINDKLHQNLEYKGDKLKKIDDKFRKTERKWQKKVDDAAKKLDSFVPNDYILNKKDIEVSLANKLLANELKVFIKEQGKSYLSSLDNSYFNRARSILKNVEKKPVVVANVTSVGEIGNKVKELINKQHLEIDKIRNLIQKMERGEKVDINSDLFVKQNNLVSSVENEKTIVFKASLFDVDKTTRSIIEKSKSPEQYYIGMYSKLLKKADEKVSKYEKVYPKYQTIKNTINATKFIIYDKDKLSYADTVTSNPPLIADPSQSIRGLYMEGKNDIYYNVLADKQKANKIRIKGKYFTDDINKDNKKDLIWYDNYSIYIKYSNDKKLDNGEVITKQYIYPSVVKSFKNIVDDDGYVDLQGEKFKIWSDVLPVNTLKNVGNSFDFVKLRWKKTDNVNAYLIIYSSRVDVLDGIEKKYNYAASFDSYEKYAIIVYDKNIKNLDLDVIQSSTLQGQSVVVKKIIPKDFKDKSVFTIYLNKKDLFLHGKWKYYRIYGANIKNNVLTIKSSYSNQDVGGEQLIGDSSAPIVEPILIRDKTNKVVGTGKNLIAYVNTSYTLKAIWKDNVAVKKVYITDLQNNVLANGNELKIPPVDKVGIKNYFLVGEDYNGNITSEQVRVNFIVPDIKITSINEEAGKVVSNIGNDMDKTAVKYAMVNGNEIKILNTINGKNLFTGGVGEKIFTGSIFDTEKKVKLYNKEQKQIGYLNLETGILKLDPPYYILGIAENKTLYYAVYNEKGEKIFKLYIPSKKYVYKPEMINSGKYILKNIKNPNMGAFNNGYCLYDTEHNVCAIYFTDKGGVYVDKDYENKFVWDYEPNKLGNISTTLYDVSVPDKSLLTNDKKILHYVFKAKSFIK